MRTRSPTPVERCQPVVFWQWMVSTDTRGCGSYTGHRSVALTWSSVVDDRPDRSSRTGRRHRRNVCRECSSKSIHCSKVHGSYHPRTIGLDSFTHAAAWSGNQGSVSRICHDHHDVGAEDGLRAPLMAHRAATGSCSLARRPRARQTGWFARARVAVR